MVWIKRNLFFVIAMAVGLLVTGYCGYLLYGSMRDNSGAADEYNSTRDQLHTMQTQAPYPSPENIQAAKADQERVRAFLGDFRKRFVAFPPPPHVDQKGFKTYLEDTLVRLRAEATNAGVQLPEGYNFSFTGLMGRLTYPPENLEPWMQQLEEMSGILNVLYQAKVNSISAICRVPVSSDDAGTSDCMLGSASVTNSWGVVTPYKITFRGFSAELASVLAGFAQSSNCFIVKSVEVLSDKSSMPAPTVGAAPSALMQTYYVPAPTAAPSPSMGRYRGDRGAPGGLRPTPAPMMQMQAVATQTPAGPVTVLAETPLLITLSVDVVKLNAAER